MMAVKAQADYRRHGDEIAVIVKEKIVDVRYEDIKKTNSSRLET
jgi:hypothetical protein